MNAAVTQMRSDTTAMRPFQVNVPEAELTELRRRIKATRLPEKEPVADMSQGVPLATVEKLTNCARASDHCADSQQEAASSMLRRGWATDIVIESAVGDYPVFVCVECCDRSRTSTPSLTVVVGHPPFARNQTVLLETLERGIERPLVHRELAVGHLLHSLTDAPAVHRRKRKRLEDEEIKRAAQGIDGWAWWHLSLSREDASSFCRCQEETRSRGKKFHRPVSSGRQRDRRAHGPDGP